METNLNTLRRIIENCRFAAMKCWGFENMLQKRCITETMNIREDGILECIIHDAAHPTKRKAYTKNSKVDLKYINKEQNIYLTLKGRVSDILVMISDSNEQDKKQTIYLIKVLEMELYERKYYSNSLSFLHRKKKQGILTPAA